MFKTYYLYWKNLILLFRHLKSQTNIYYSFLIIKVIYLKSQKYPNLYTLFNPINFYIVSISKSSNKAKK